VASTITVQLTDQDEADFKLLGLDAAFTLSSALNNVRSQAAGMRKVALIASIEAMSPAAASALSATLATTVTSFKLP